MVYAQIISIEYKSEYGDSEVYTQFSYSSGTIGKRRFYEEIVNDHKAADEIVKRLTNGETIRLVGDWGAGCYGWEVYYLISTTPCAAPDLQKWVEEIEAKYDSIACDSDTIFPNDLYHKKWPGYEHLGIPAGFEEAENIDYLIAISDEEDDEEDDDSDIWS